MVDNKIPDSKTTPKQGTRAGGRSARRALRSAPLAEDLKPVRPGMEGGTYKPLKDTEVIKNIQCCFGCFRENRFVSGT